MNIRTAASAILTATALAWVAHRARAQPIPTSLTAGDFTYQFADPTTGQPITSLSIASVGDTARVAIYLSQQGGTPTNLFQQLGMEGLGVRVNYAAPAGIVMVPNTLNANITPRPPPTFNPNGNSSDYDFVGRYGNNTGSNTTTSAAISDGLLSASDPLPFPGAEDPLGIGSRMLIGTFTFQALADGMESVTAVSGPSLGTNNLTGPNPPIIGPRNDGTTGPVPGNSAQGEIFIDRLLSTTVPTLTITVGAGGFGVPTWLGSASGSWNTSGNWSSGIPPSNIDTQLAFGPAANATMTNDIPGTFTLNQMTFYAGSPAYSLAGNGLVFATNSSGVLPQIVVNSTSGVSIGAAMMLANNLTVNAAGSLTLTGLISGPGGLAKTGTGTLALGNASNSFSGGVTFSGGTLTAANLGVLGTGPLTFDGGMFSYSGPTGTTTAPINVTGNNGTITVASASLTATAAITGPGGLTKSGLGTLVLTGSNTYAGPTNITAGTVAVPTGAALGTGAITVARGSTLGGTGTINGTTAVAGTVAPGLGGVGAFNFTAPMTWQPLGSYAFGFSAVTGLNPGVNYTTITSSSTLDLSALTAAQPFIIGIASLNGQTTNVPVTFTLGTFNNGGSGNGITGFNPASFAFAGAFSGTPSVSLDAAHDQLLLTVIPASANSQTWIGSASGSWNNSANWSGGVPPSNANTQLAFGVTSNPSMTNDIPGTLMLNQMTFNAGAPAYTLDGNGLNFVTNSAAVSPQILTNSANAVTINAAIPLTNVLTVTGSGDLTLAGLVSGTNGLVKSGTGTLTINNSTNTFSGGVTLSGGTVVVNSLGALGAGSLLLDGGVFLYSGSSAATAASIGITSNSGTITVASSATTLTMSAAIAGTGGLTKSGAGTLLLTGNNFYIGATSVIGGTVTIAMGAAIGNGAVTVGPAGILAGNGTINGPTQIAGTIAPGISGVGALNFTAPVAWDAGAMYAFAFSAVTGLNPGVNYNTINSSSTLNLSALTAGDPFTIAITSLNTQTNSAPVTFALGTFTGGVTGFIAADFAFSGAYSGTPSVGLDSTGSQLLLTLRPVVPPNWSGAANGSWSNSANWTTGVPVSDPSTQLTFGATPNAAMTNDIPGTLILNQLTFNSGAPVYALSGNGLDFRSNAAGSLPQIMNNSANAATISTAVALTNSLTVSGPGAVNLTGVMSGPGSLTYAGTGTLTLGNAGNTYAGGTIIQDGTLGVVADSALGTGPVTIASAFATLSYSATTSTTRSFTLNGGTLAAGAGATLTLNGATVTNGYLAGSGTLATDPTNGARFANITSQPSVTIASNSAADLFLNFTNGGPLNIAANIPAATPVTLTGFTNQGSGSLTVGAASRANVANFQSFGVVTINPAVVGGGQFTLLTDAGPSALSFNGGSRTYLGTSGTVGPPQNPNYVAAIDLHGNNAVIAGGLFVNNGFVTDSVGGGSVIVDYGALYKGAGTTFVNVITQNGGKVQAGNSPGAASYGGLTIGPGGIGNFNWQINDAGPSIYFAAAPGVGGPLPNSNNQVSGWSQLQSNTLTDPLTHKTSVGNLTWTATSAPGSQFTLALETLLGPETPVGTSPDGPISDFNPSAFYQWPIITYQGTYAGPTDSATLTADTLIDTTLFANSFYVDPYLGGGFSIVLDQVNKSIDLRYFEGVPEPGTFALVTTAAVALAWRRRRPARARRRGERLGDRAIAVAALGHGVLLDEHSARL